MERRMHRNHRYSGQNYSRLRSVSPRSQDGAGSLDRRGSLDSFDDEAAFSVSRICRTSFKVPDATECPLPPPRFFSFSRCSERPPSHDACKLPIPLPGLQPKDSIHYPPGLPPQRPWPPVPSNDVCASNFHTSAVEEDWDLIRSQNAMAKQPPPEDRVLSIPPAQTREWDGVHAETRQQKETPTLQTAGTRDRWNEEQKGGDCPAPKVQTLLEDIPSLDVARQAWWMQTMQPCGSEGNVRHTEGGINPSCNDSSCSTLLAPSREFPLLSPKQRPGARCRTEGHSGRQLQSPASPCTPTYCHPLSMVVGGDGSISYDSCSLRPSRQTSPPFSDESLHQVLFQGPRRVDDERNTSPCLCDQCVSRRTVLSSLDKFPSPSGRVSANTNAVSLTSQTRSCRPLSSPDHIRSYPSDSPAHIPLYSPLGEPHSPPPADMLPPPPVHLCAWSHSHSLARSASPPPSSRPSPSLLYFSALSSGPPPGLSPSRFLPSGCIGEREAKPLHPLSLSLGTSTGERARRDHEHKARSLTLLGPQSTAETKQRRCTEGDNCLFGTSALSASDPVFEGEERPSLRDDDPLLSTQLCALSFGETVHERRGGERDSNERLCAHVFPGSPGVCSRRNGQGGAERLSSHESGFEEPVSASTSKQATEGVRRHMPPLRSHRAIGRQGEECDVRRSSVYELQIDEEERSKESSGMVYSSVDEPHGPLLLFSPLSPRLPPAASGETPGDGNAHLRVLGDGDPPGVSTEVSEKCLFHVSRLAFREKRGGKRGRGHARRKRLVAGVRHQGPPLMQTGNDPMADKVRGRLQEARHQLQEIQGTQREKNERKGEEQMLTPGVIDPTGSPRRERRRNGWTKQAPVYDTGDQGRHGRHVDSDSFEVGKMRISYACTSCDSYTRGEVGSVLEDARTTSKMCQQSCTLPVTAVGTQREHMPPGVSLHPAPSVFPSWNKERNSNCPVSVQASRESRRKAMMETGVVPQLRLSRAAETCVGTSGSNDPLASPPKRVAKMAQTVGFVTPTTINAKKRIEREKRNVGEKTQTLNEKPSDEDVSNDNETLQDVYSVVSSRVDTYQDVCESRVSRREGETSQVDQNCDSLCSLPSLSACLDVFSVPSENTDTFDAHLASYAPSDSLELSEHPLAWGMSSQLDSTHNSVNVRPSASRRSQDADETDSSSDDAARGTVVPVSMLSSHQKRSSSSLFFWACIDETAKIQEEGPNGEATTGKGEWRDNGDAFPPLESTVNTQQINMHKSRERWTEVHTVGDEAWETETEGLVGNSRRKDKLRGVSAGCRGRRSRGPAINDDSLHRSTSPRHRNECTELLKALGLSSGFSSLSAISTPPTASGRECKTKPRARNSVRTGASRNEEEDSYVWWDKEERNGLSGAMLEEIHASFFPQLSSHVSTPKGRHEGRSMQRKEKATNPTQSLPSFSAMASGNATPSRSGDRVTRAEGPRRNGSDICRSSDSTICSSPQSSVMYPDLQTGRSFISKNPSSCEAPKPVPGDCQAPVVYVAWWPTAPEHLFSVFEETGVCLMGLGPRGVSSEIGGDGETPTNGVTPEDVQTEILRRQLATLRLDGIQYVLRNGSGLACIVGFFTERHRDAFLSYYGSTEAVGSMRQPPRWLCDICLVSVLALSSLFTSVEDGIEAPTRRKRPHSCGQQADENPKRETDTFPGSSHFQRSSNRDFARPLWPSEALPHATVIAKRAWQSLRRSGFEDVIMAPASLASEDAALITPGGCPVEDTSGTGVTLAPPCLGVFLSWLPFAVWTGGQRSARAYLNDRMQRIFHFKCRRMQFLPNGGAQLEFDSPAYATRFMKRYGGPRDCLQTQRFIDHFFRTLDLFINPTERLTATLFIFQLATYPLLSALPSLAWLPTDPLLSVSGPVESQPAASGASQGEATQGEDTASERCDAKHRDRREGRCDLETACKDATQEGEDGRRLIQQRGAIRKGGWAARTKKKTRKNTREGVTNAKEGHSEREDTENERNGRQKVDLGCVDSSVHDLKRYKNTSKVIDNFWAVQRDGNGTCTRECVSSSSSERYAHKLPLSLLTSGFPVSGSPPHRASSSSRPSSTGGDWWGLTREQGEQKNGVSSGSSGFVFESLPPSEIHRTEAVIEASDVFFTSRNGQQASLRVSSKSKRREKRNCSPHLAVYSASLSSVSSYLSLSSSSS